MKQGLWPDKVLVECREEKKNEEEHQLEIKEENVVLSTSSRNEEMVSVSQPRHPP